MHGNHVEHSFSKPKREIVLAEVAVFNPAITSHHIINGQAEAQRICKTVLHIR
jgi:hypothetical protein